MKSIKLLSATGPSLFAPGFVVECVGPEKVMVAAGTFDALHFRFVDTTGQLPQEHPPYDVRCTADSDYIFLKGGVAICRLITSWLNFR